MKIITKEELRNSALEEKKEFKAFYKAPNEPAGEMALQNTGTSSGAIFTQEMFSRLAKGEKEAAGEMSMQDVRAFIQNATVDVTKAMAANPTLYQFIYDEIFNSEFTETIDVRDLIGLQAAFGIVNAGESVPLAGWKTGKLETVKMIDYACGYSVLEKWVRYNQFWNVGQANRAMGIAHNAILDHIYLSPIINGTYSGGSITNKVTGAAYTNAKELEIIYYTLRKGIKDALKRQNAHGFRLRPTIALCNSATAMDVEAAVAGMLQNGSQLGALGQIKTVLAYDGWQGEVKGEKVTFEAPKDNEVYLIQPKDMFKSLVKTDITQLTQKGDIMKLSNLDVVQFFSRAVVADVSGSVHKVVLA